MSALPPRRPGADCGAGAMESGASAAQGAGGDAATRLQRLGAALTHTSQAMLDTPDLTEFAARVCRIVVEEAGLASAAVRLADRGRGTLDTYAAAGLVIGRISGGPVRVDDPDSATARVAREKRPHINNDIGNDAWVGLAREEARALGLNARAMFPLLLEDECFGVFILLARETGYFDRETTRLFEQMTRNFAAAFARLRAERALAQSEARYRSLFDANPEAIRIMQDERVVLANPACVRLFGYRQASELVGRITADTYAPPWREAAIERRRRVMELGETVPVIEQGLLRADGSVVMVETLTMPIEFGGRRAALSILRDLTAAKQAALRVERLSRLRLAQSKTNEAIVRSTGRDALARAVCEIAVTHGGLTTAVVRVPDQESAYLEVIAAAGALAGRVGVAPMALDNPARPLARVFFEGRPLIDNNIGADRPGELSSDAARLGLRSRALFPLMIEGRCAGVLAVFSSEPEFFDAEHAGLIAEMAANLAYAFARQRTEASLARVTRFYAALSKTSAAIIRAGDLLTLCQNICEIAVTEGGLVSAVIRAYDPQTNMLEPFGGYGPRQDMLGVTPVSLDDPLALSARAARERGDYVCNDLLADPAAARSHEAARRIGVRASAGFSLSVDGALVGVLSVYAGETGFFDPALTGLLHEMAENLSYAFSKQHADAALGHSEQRYRTLFDASPDAIGVIRDGRVALVNPAAVRMLGYGREDELLGRPALEVIAPEDREDAHLRWSGATQERRVSPGEELTVLRADGSRLAVEVVTLPVTYEGGPAALSIARDLTERKAAQARVRRLSSLYLALSKTNEAIFRATGDEDLCAAVCEIAVTHGGLASAVIRRVEPAARTLVPYSGHGPLQGRAGGDVISLDDAQSATARALRDLKPYISNNFGADPQTRHIGPDAQAVGARAAAVFPLTVDGERVGVLSVFAAEAGYFDDEITGLLLEMTRNLSYAFSKLRSAEALAMSEERYRALFEASPDAVRVFCNTRVLLANPAALKLFGHASFEQAAAAPLLEAVDPAQRERVRERMRIVLYERRAVPRIEQVLVRPDGSRVTVEAVILPVTFEGKPAALSILRDLTEKKAAERRLARLTDFYVALSRTNETIFREHDLPTLCRKVCELAVAHGGLALAAIRVIDHDTASLPSLCHAGTASGPMGVAPISLNEAIHPAARVARAGGHYISNDMQADPNVVADAEGARAIGIRAGAAFALTVEGKPVGLLAAFATETGFFDPELTGLFDELARNLSFAFARAQNAALLAASQERYRALFEASPDAIRVICEERVALINPAGVRLFGVSEATGLTGQKVEETIAPEFRALAAERLRQVLQDRRPAPPCELTLLRADGSRVDAEVVALPFEFEGKPAALSIVHDLTARKAVERTVQRMNAQLEERVQRRTAELKQANADLEAFSYTVAHDLRAPLRRMSGYATLLGDKLGDLDEEGRDFLKRIDAGAGAMGTLIEGLLEIARVGRAELKPADLDLTGLAHALSRDLRARDPARAAEFVIAPGLAARADPRLVHDVMENLLDNAWKFTSGKSAARIEFGALPPGMAPPCAPGAALCTSEGEGQAWRVFYVRDDGAGFDNRYVGKLFGTFQRLHSQSEFPGTGVGLASAARIITHHAGRVWAEGETDKGATFYFSLPLVPHS